MQIRKLAHNHKCRRSAVIGYLNAHGKSLVIGMIAAPSSHESSPLGPFVFNSLEKLPSAVALVAGRVKNSMHAVIISGKLEASTLLTQVEAILNSRPLVSLDCDNDPDSLNILTPSHFLIGEVITSSPEHNNDDKLSLRSRWDIVQKMNDEAHFWLNGYVNKQNCRIWSEANPQVYVEKPLHPEKLTLWSALWAGGIILQKQ
ncbi:DUF5641 domain-containing protein [Trichonephila clavipes]|nr:DUF5641 domain-containing protein [Trichonephila clavipes]